MPSEPEPRHMTIPEVAAKLEAIDAARERDFKVLANAHAKERASALAKLARIRKVECASLAESYKAKRGKLAAYLDVLKMEGTHDTD